MDLIRSMTLHRLIIILLHGLPYFRKITFSTIAKAHYLHYLVNNEACCGMVTSRYDTLPVFDTS